MEDSSLILNPLWMGWESHLNWSFKKMFSPHRVKNINWPRYRFKSSDSHCISLGKKKKNDNKSLRSNLYYHLVKQTKKKSALDILKLHWLIFLFAISLESQLDTGKLIHLVHNKVLASST